MVIVDEQLHGYRHGHELLSTSVRLPKEDQDWIDRLSDVAGPLRPGERFEPYLTCYPLPSGQHYVVARTWQDFAAPRAGCVRTRSAIVPMAEWMRGIDIAGLVAQLTTEGDQSPAEPMPLKLAWHELPHVEASYGTELLEAMFLEDRKPIVVFDAVAAENMTVRLLAAFWPSFRTVFSVSTFALSPRQLGGKSFDLIFAPGDARSRFSEWEGRRIDGRKGTSGRHRWSNQIAERVFSDASPSLIRKDILGDLSSGGDEADLRISLLWNDLHDKLESSPNAALGLLDIANSRSTRNLDAIRHLEPELARAARRAAATLTPVDAWRFLYALMDKLRDFRLQLSTAKIVRSAAIDLAERAPLDAIANLDVVGSGVGGDLLLGAIGDGLAQDLSVELCAKIAELPSAQLLRLLLLSRSLAAATLPRFPVYASQIAAALAEAPENVRQDAKRHLLRFLVQDQHVEAAASLIRDLGREELLGEVKLLAGANGLKAEGFHRPLAARAASLGIVPELREMVAALPAGGGTEALLLLLISAMADDVNWLLGTGALTDDRRLNLLRKVLDRMTGAQLKSISASANSSAILAMLLRDPARNFGQIDRLLEVMKPDPLGTVDAILQLLPYANRDQARRLAWQALEILLAGGSRPDRREVMEALLMAIGADLDGARAVRLGLGRDVPGGIAAANLTAFNRSRSDARRKVVGAVEELARILVARGRIDYGEQGSAEAANLLWDAASKNQRAFVTASSLLLPFLLRARGEPAGPLIAATFPPVYHELRKADDAPDFLRFFLFVDWDKCKVARRDLVDAFMRSKWRATDVALAAARAGDAARILRRISRQNGGDRIIENIERDLNSIPDPWRKDVRYALRTFRGGSIIGSIDY